MKNSLTAILVIAAFSVGVVMAPVAAETQPEPTPTAEAAAPEAEEETHVREGYRDRLTEPFGNVIPACGPDGAYVDIATGVGDFTLAFDGTVSETWTVTADEVSELGLVARGFVIPEGTETVEMIGTTEGTTTVLSSGTLSLPCLTEPEPAPIVEPAPEPTTEEANDTCSE